MMKSDKIFVAGHSGMVGSAIHQMLKANGFDNIIYRNSSELDLRNQKSTLEFFESEKPNYVFLAAAKVGGIVANDTYKAEFIYDNLTIAANVIHSSYLTGVKKLVNLGSSCIYPKFANQPMSENQLLQGELESTNEPYAIAKIAAIKLCRYYNEQYKTNFISLMPTNLFGYNDNYNLETSHVLPALIRKMILGKALMEGDFELIIKDISKKQIGFGIDKILVSKSIDIPEALSRVGIHLNHIDLWGSGTVKREFLFADDLADAAIYFMLNIDYPQSGEIINIGTGEDISISALANMIKDIIGYKGKLEFDSSKPDGTPRKLLDVSKAKSLGWKYSIGLNNGIQNIKKSYLNSL